MTPDQPARLVVHADLHLDAGGVPVEISGAGDRLLVTTDHPIRLAREAVPLASLIGTPRASSVLSRLRAEGITVTLAGRRGALVHVGAAGGPLRLRPAMPLLARGAAVVLMTLATATVVVRIVRR